MSKNIIIVDDEPFLLELVQEVLEEQGFMVRVVSSGEDAVEICLHHDFDLLIVDAFLPGMDGLETFARIKEQQPHMVGVLMTGEDSMQLAVKAINMGFGGLLMKPFKSEELLKTVDRALHNALLIEENTRLNAIIPLYRLGAKFISSETEGDVVEELIKTVKKQTGADRISVMLFDKDQGVLKVEGAYGLDESKIRQSSVAPGDRISGWVYSKARPLILNGGPDSNPEFSAFMKSEEIVAAVSLPMKRGNKVLGVINVSKMAQGTPFRQSDIEMLSVICDQAAMALENIRAIKEREEKVRIKALLEQYVAPEVADVLISHNQDLLNLGEIRYMTVLFADIRKSTSLVSRLPLKTARSFLNDFYSMVTEVIFLSKGTLDKFMGDAILAVFGAPVDIDNPDEVAVSAAIDIMEKFNNLKKTWRPVNVYFDQIGLGIGISSGELFLGNVGSEQRLDYTVIGSDVNLAQRLASEAKSGEILVSQRVLEKLPDNFAGFTKASCHPKGIDKPIDVFSISRVGSC